MLSEAQKQFILERGSDVDLVNQQIDNFIQGFPFLKLSKPAVVGDGLLKLNEEEANQYKQYYEVNSKSKNLLKFVPASGAASRMFKELFSYIDKGENNLEGAAGKFIEGIQKFAFVNDLDAALQKAGTDLETTLQQGNYVKIAAALLEESGLNYGNLPKGLLKFHQYENSSRTPMEEHLVEGARYAAGSGNEVNIHFTVSPEHRVKFESLVRELQSQYELELGVKYTISFSLQKKSTDTIAVDLNNDPFKESDGTILFRPAGHGALLENLNDLEAEIIFIKNIDNVVPDRIKADTVLYKKVLGGVLLNTQSKIFDYLDKIDQSAVENAEVEDFITSQLGVAFPSEYTVYDDAKKKEYLKNILDRPIKVCGMVENKGEPGGGPFWVSAEDGSMSLQIAESAQIDMNDEAQLAILKNSSHFNPVDLVCGVTDRKGKAYNLLDFRDPSTGFITEKSKDGRELKAQELPGLWNGAMAFWNTIFVEVPIITFNPVKTVNDLLREEHQN